MQTGRVKRILGITFLLLLSYTAFCQPKIKGDIYIDTIPLPTPEISVSNNCSLGITSLSINLNLDEADTNFKSKTVSLLKLKKSATLLDSISNPKDTIELIGIYSIDDLEKREYTLQPQKEGKYILKVQEQTNDTLRLSNYSNIANVSYCSALEFSNVFDISETGVYTPKKIFNVQVIEFSIFDRVGSTVYTHTNNSITWNGNYPDGQKCPNGIYYYHCEFVDVTNNKVKKSKSGMIELKGNN